MQHDPGFLALRRRPGNPPLTLDDFRALRPGAVLILHYRCVNQGTFVWIHDRVDDGAPCGEGRIVGRYAYPGENLADVPVSAWLYVFQGVVVRGSGAEPVFLEMPAARTDHRGRDPRDPAEDEDDLAEEEV